MLGWEVEVGEGYLGGCLGWGGADGVCKGGRCTMVGVSFGPFLGGPVVPSLGGSGYDYRGRSTGCRSLECLHRSVGRAGTAVERDVTVFAC